VYRPSLRHQPLGSRSPDWLKFKYPAAPAAKREAEERVGDTVGALRDGLHGWPCGNRIGEFVRELST
jgi:hypothetical protein